MQRTRHALQGLILFDSAETASEINFRNEEAIKIHFQYCQLASVGAKLNISRPAEAGRHWSYQHQINSERVHVYYQDHSEKQPKIQITPGT